jgi:hypothetical protein
MEFSQSEPKPQDIVDECQKQLAHAWVVRAFVRHSDEAEDFPEITEIGRAVFDLTRALESRVSDPAGYFCMLRKKLGKFRQVSEEFANETPMISTHTNFKQAVVSIRAVVERLEQLLDAGLRSTSSG